MTFAARNKKRTDDWAVWFARKFGEHAEELADVLGDEVGKITQGERKLMREYVAAELRKLRDELRPPEDDKVLEWPRKPNAA